MKIGVISDTHGCLRDDALEILNDCDAVVHAGDIDNDDIYERLAAAGTFYAVQGNADIKMKNKLEKCISFEIDGVKFVLAHNKKTIGRQPSADIAVYGHTHRYAEMKDSDGVLWLNPGYCGAPRLNQKITMAIVETAGGEYSVKRIALEDKKANVPQNKSNDILHKIEYIVRHMDKNEPIDKISSKIGVSPAFAETIYRIRVTHPSASANDIYNKLEVNETIKREFL